MHKCECTSVLALEVRMETNFKEPVLSKTLEI